MWIMFEKEAVNMVKEFNEVDEEDKEMDGGLKSDMEVLVIAGANALLLVL